MAAGPLKPMANHRMRMRSFANCRAMRLMALLVALLLPLHGVASGRLSIQNPAHYHRHVAEAAPPTATHHHLHRDEVRVRFDADPAPDHDAAHARIDHHAHGLGEADVVYHDGDGDPRDPVSGGKHFSFAGEVTLPGWLMPRLLSTTSQALSEPASGYRSYRIQPPLRPPSRSRRVPA